MTIGRYLQEEWTMKDNGVEEMDMTIQGMEESGRERERESRMDQKRIHGKKGAIPKMKIYGR
jgi:hypothetical protein